MSFVFYDVVFLAICIILFIVFIYKKKHNLKRQGIMYLYPTKVGIIFIDKFTQKYEKILRPLQYVILLSGYLLMVSMVWFFVKFTYSYLSSTELVHALKVPVLMPLIPYLPELFNIDFLPPFYFTYWIIVIALIAVPHEFAHGIFARLHKVTVHSTGFGFLGPFLAAFVEPDEKQMEKRGIFPQLVVLAAGTFANVITAILAGLVLWIFFSAAFVPAGITFNTYATTTLNVSEIDAIGGVPLSNFSLDSVNQSEKIMNLTANNATYLTSPEILTYMVSNNFDYMIVYEDSPALKVRLSGIITAIDNRPVRSYVELREILAEHHPGDNITITTQGKDEMQNKTTLALGNKGGNAFLGIGAIPMQRSGLFKPIYAFITKVKDPNTYYVSRIGDFGIFIYDLLWWSVLICISVALVNMVPIGMFDGGRFFYLTVLAITKNKKFSMGAFKFATWFLLALVALLMVKWIFAFI
jgi:membrane-associated protease RseP (regulator of RpoE activity)